MTSKRTSKRELCDVLENVQRDYRDALFHALDMEARGDARVARIKELGSKVRDLEWELAEAKEQARSMMAYLVATSDEPYEAVVESFSASQDLAEHAFKTADEMIVDAAWDRMSGVYKWRIAHKHEFENPDGDRLWEELGMTTEKED